MYTKKKKKETFITHGCKKPRCWWLTTVIQLLGKLILGGLWLKASPDKQFSKQPKFPNNQSKVDWSLELWLKW
jgi:hypothetical protein